MRRNIASFSSLKARRAAASASGRRARAISSLLLPEILVRKSASDSDPPPTESIALKAARWTGSLSVIVPSRSNRSARSIGWLRGMGAPGAARGQARGGRHAGLAA